MNKRPQLTTGAKIVCTAIYLLVCFNLIAQTSHSTRITFIVRDQHTGFAVWGATVKATTPDGSNSVVINTDANGKGVFEAIKGRYTFLISTEGYKPKETFFEAGNELATEANIDLEPAINAPSAHAAKQGALPQPVIVQGFVRDAGANIPLAGVAIQAGKATTITNSYGYFRIPANTSAQRVEERNTSNKITVQFSKQGYISHSIENIAGADHVKIALTAKAASIVQHNKK